jgi:hypothetical protein
MQNEVVVANFTVLFWQLHGVTKEATRTSVRILSVVAEIRTEHLLYKSEL